MLGNTCLICGKNKVAIFHAGMVCSTCMRLHNPPRMTLIRFEQGNYRRLWNVEIGVYEEIKDINDLTEFCGWICRSKQETLYRVDPKVEATVYHLEYFGKVKCGRCVDYPYFESDDHCLSSACEKVAFPFKEKSLQQGSSEESRYIKWIGEIEKEC